MENTINFNDVKTAFVYKTNKELQRTFFVYKIIQKPIMVKLLTRISFWIIKYKLPFKFLLKKTMFQIFCAGIDLKETSVTIRHLKQYNVKTVLDYVAEGDKSDKGFDSNLKTILQNIECVKGESPNAFVGVKLSGLEDVEFIKEINDVHVISDEIKLRRMNKFINRVNKICAEAVSKNVKVYFDAEERSTQDVYDFLVEKMMKTYNTECVYVYNTLQMYLKDRLEYLEYCIEDAEKQKYKLGFKLVRGAYVEKEREEAIQKEISSPVFDTKIETDLAFDKALTICLMNTDLIETCIATHNEKSIQLAIDIIEKNNISDHQHKVYFSQLYGMSDNLTFNLASKKYNSSKYVPYGELEKAIPYLLRRAAENSSIEGQVSREYELLKKEVVRRKLKH